MSEPKVISPLLDNYIVGDPISEKKGVRCCPALERNNQSKNIVKIISTPTSQNQLDALLLSGAYPDAESALQYFKAVADGIAEEAKTLQRLSQLEGFYGYTDWQIVQMDDGVGYDVYAISEDRKTLHKLLKGDNLTHLAAVNLGLDLCTALAVCRRLGFLYVNLKPENIYLSDNNSWKIGDIGFISLDCLKYASLPERYRSEYTAPEISDAFASLNTTLDVYALGLVLYRIYNGNVLPQVQPSDENASLVPPDYADYEMSEIILKACDPNPENRWQDPIEMGQALVSYMQRNSVNDTPIVPAPIVTDSPVEEPQDEDIATDEAAPIEANPGDSVAPADVSTGSAVHDSTLETSPTAIAEDLIGILAPSGDETSPEQNNDQLDNIPVTDEVSSILALADDLAAHPTPEMSDVIKNTPEEVTIDEGSAPVDTAVNVNAATADENTPIDDQASCNQTPPVSDELETEPDDDENDEPQVTVPEDAVPATDDESATPDKSGDETAEDVPDDSYQNVEEAQPAKKKKKSHWIIYLLAGAILLLIAAAFLFYIKVYRQTIDDLNVIQSTNGDVAIHVQTKTDESKLTVVCTDAYNNPRKASVTDGIAVFEDLEPGTAYSVKIKIKGFHTLVGKTTTSFTTPSKIEVLGLEALTGDEDGSVLLRFDVQDQDAGEWTVAYTADDGTKTTETFGSHNYTIRGLTVGKEYTFAITPVSELEYFGSTEVTHTVSAVILPENLQILSIADNKMTASWTSQSGVRAWKVRCYNESGYDQLLETEETSVVFEGIDPASSYTLSVTAAGMSKSVIVKSPANAITVTDFKATETDTLLTLSWICNLPDAPSNWLVSYSIDESEGHEVSVEGKTDVVLENRIPGSKYVIQLKTSDGSDVLGGRLILDTAKAKKFSGFSVSAADMRFDSCRTPSKSNWSKKDLKDSDYTSTFKIGEKASFLVSLKTSYKISDEEVVTLFVFRDENGIITDTSSSVRTWRQMWYKNLCELDIPALPDTAGQYTVSIFMNGMLAGESKITITD